MLPPNVNAWVAVEEGSTLGWERYMGASGRIIGMKTFGARHHSKNSNGTSDLSQTAWLRQPKNYWVGAERWPSFSTGLRSLPNQRNLAG